MARTGGKVSAPKVRGPKGLSGADFYPTVPDRRLFPHVSPPRIKPLKTRIYAKGVVPGADPGQYTNIGFGNTGRTGES